MHFFILFIPSVLLCVFLSWVPPVFLQLVFLLLVGWAFGRSSRDAIFIKEAGPDHLPYVYIIGSLIVMASAPFYSMVVGRIARHRFMIGQLIGSEILLVAMRMAISLDLSAMPYLLFSISQLVIIVLFYMHFWMFANVASMANINVFFYCF